MRFGKIKRLREKLASTKQRPDERVVPACIEPLEQRQLLSVSVSSVGHSNSSQPAFILPFPPISSETGSVSGSVDNLSGTGIVGATVYLIPSGAIPLATNASASSTANVIGILPGRLPLTATTDQSGNFSLATVPVGTYTASASDDGYTTAASASFTVTQGVNTAVPAITLTAQPTPVVGTVTGTITDASGNPLSNATVELLPASLPIPYAASSAAGISIPNSISIPFPIGGFQTTQTDSSGQYTFDNVKTGDYTIAAFDQGYQRNTSASFTVAQGSNTAPTVALTAIAAPVFGSVTGTITDANGNPLANAFVTLQSATLAVPDAASSNAPNIIDPVPFPIGGFQTARTDSNGQYTFDNVKTGNYTIAASDQGYQRNTSASFTVAQGTNAAPTVALIANPTPVFGSVTGTVTDASGNPIAGATVLISPVMASFVAARASASASGGGIVFPPSPARFATTDSNGQYTFTELRTGTYTVTALDKGYLKNTSASFTVAEGSNTGPTLALTARPTPVFGSVTGTVTDANGVGLANALVEISPAPASTPTPADSTTSSTTTVPPVSRPGPIQFVRTDANGNYTFSKVRAASYIVTAFDKGYQKAASDAFTVVAGTNSVSTIKLTALPTPTFGSVTGTVTDSTGTAIANAIIEIYAAPTSTSGASSSAAISIDIIPHGRIYIARTDQNGQYTFGKVLAGSYVVTAFARGYTRQTSAAFTVAEGANTAPTLALATGTVFPPAQPM